MRADQAQIKSVIESDSIYISNLIFCVNVLSEKVGASKEEFLRRFQDMFNTNNFSPVRGTFDGLISSGKIELIDNQELLDALFLYYNSNNYRSWDNAMTDYSRHVIVPYILSFDYIPNARPEDGGTEFTQFDITDFSLPSKSIEDYRNNQFILNALRLKIQLFEGQKIQYMDLQNTMARLIKSIESELEN